MKNGDRYLGHVLALDEQQLILTNENLGAVRLPRPKVLRIHLGEAAAVASAQPNSALLRAETGTAPQTDGLQALLRGIRESGIDPQAIKQVQTQFLSAAGPEANDRFNTLLDGLMNGALTLQDLRGEAQDAAQQLRGMKQELGEDTGGVLDVYLGILESFLNRSADDASPPMDAENE
jgi:hypothetical protein